MTLVHIIVFGLFSLLVGWLLPRHWRLSAIFIASLVAVYWLQPSSPIRNLDFWLPTASIGLTLFTWAITQPKEKADWRFNLLIIGSILLLIVTIGLTRYLGPLCCLTPSRPPRFSLVLISVVIIAAGTLIAYRFLPQSNRLAGGMIILIIAIFVILKYEPTSYTMSASLRTLNKQNPALANALDLSWLGFSYLAFRLIHTLRDFQTNRLPTYNANEYSTYALFYPSLTAGPIDRSQRFVQSDLRVPGPVTSADRMLGVQRILVGVFKKFVIADSLALVAINPQLTQQVNSTIWLWIMLYAFALRIYFDFSGYTDVAIGIGMLVGIHLPENFIRPYMKTNLTAFWNSWHITLAQWFRTYVFNPLTRDLRRRPINIPTWLIILTGQSVTMLLIGLWHGISWSFAIWGLWHGIGLFIQNRWSEWSRPHLANLAMQRPTRLVLSFGGWLLTFNYVALGWVWFVLPDIDLALETYRKLFGF